MASELLCWAVRRPKREGKMEEGRWFGRLLLLGPRREDEGLRPKDGRGRKGKVADTLW